MIREINFLPDQTTSSSHFPARWAHDTTSVKRTQRKTQLSKATKHTAYSHESNSKITTTRCFGRCYVWCGSNPSRSDHVPLSNIQSAQSAGNAIAAPRHSGQRSSKRWCQAVLQGGSRGPSSSARPKRVQECVQHPSSSAKGAFHCQKSADKKARRSRSWL